MFFIILVLYKLYMYINFSNTIFISLQYVLPVKIAACKTMCNYIKSIRKVEQRKEICNRFITGQYINTIQELLCIHVHIKYMYNNVFYSIHWLVIYMYMCFMYVHVHVATIQPLFSVLTGPHLLFTEVNHQGVSRVVQNISRVLIQALEFNKEFNKELF